jgi:hypothetical protein
VGTRCIHEDLRHAHSANYLAIDAAKIARTLLARTTAAEGWVSGNMHRSQLW